MCLNIKLGLPGTIEVVLVVRLVVVAVVTLVVVTVVAVIFTVSLFAKVELPIVVERVAACLEK